MLGPQEIRDSVERVVIDEDGAEQRLFSFDVAWRGARRGFRARWRSGGEKLYSRHDFLFGLVEVNAVLHALCNGSAGQRNRPGEAMLLS